jgi:small subunit ribosomal protein S7
MPRRRKPQIREIVPDPVYNSQLAEKFVNSMMWDGKKAISQKIFYAAMDMIKSARRTIRSSTSRKAVRNCKPLLEVKTRRVGGANYQVPVEVSQARRTSLAIRWILINARSRPEKGMPEKLANELNDAANSRGGAIKEKGRRA